MNKAKNSIPNLLPRVVGAKFFSILLIASLFSLSSCDEASVVGLDVQPDGDLLNIGFQDTTTLRTRTVLIDSLQTDESIVTNGTSLLGKYIDPVFGEASASIYTQVRLLSNAPNFGPSPVCDSVVVSLRYNGTFYGKSNLKPQTINVYQVNEDMTTGKQYFSNQSLAVLPNDLTIADGYTFTPAPFKTWVIDGDSLKPQIRIVLDPEFGQAILNNQGTSSLNNDVNFRAFMKGLYITTQGTTGLSSTDGNILHLNMVESQMVIYYSNPSLGIHKKKSYTFSLGSVARFNHFTHNFTDVHPQLTSQLAITGTDTVEHELVFLQSMAGLKTKIEMPYLKNWLDSGMIAINKAELIVKEYKAPESFSSRIASALTFPYSGMFVEPETLIVFGITDAGLNYALPDYGEGTTYFGGNYNSNSKEYHFNIARHIQQVLSGTVNNNGLYLFTTSGSVSAKRVVVGGGKPGPYQMKLNITYTKLN